jgi:hypothetical protein
MSESSSCAHCANENPEGACVCANCGMPVSEAAPPQDDEALPREVPADTQTQAPFHPVGQPISLLPPTREAQQSRVRRGWPTYLTLRKFAKTKLPSWFTLPVAVIASVVLTLALFSAYGSVQAGVFDPLAFTKPLQGESKEAQTAPADAPTATRSPSLSTSPSDMLSSFLPPFLSSSPWVPELLSPSASDAQSPQTPSSASPSPSSISDEAGACQQETDADDFAQALDFSDAKSLAQYLGLEGGKDKLARGLRDCNDLEDLARSLGFSNPERLAEYLGLDDKRELGRSLRVSGELNRLAESVGLDTTEELAERLGVDKRKLVRGLQDSENFEELAASLGLDTTDELDERLGLGKGELSTLLNSAITDGGNRGTSTTPTDATSTKYKVTTDEDKPESDNGKSDVSGDTSTTNDDSKSATKDGGATAKETAGADEAGASTVSSASPPSLPKASPPSPAPATQDPPATTEEASSVLTSDDPPSEPLSASSTSETPTSEPSQEPTPSEPPQEPALSEPPSPSTSETPTSELP